MKIETCVNLNINLRDQLTDAARSLKMRRSNLVVLLLSRIIADKGLKPNIFNRIKYQEEDPLKNWKKIHVGMMAGDYEKAMELRNLMKLSVSGILAFAIIKYLPAILTGEEISGSIEKTDNSMIFFNFISNFNSIDAYFAVLWMLPHYYKKKNPPIH